MKKLSYLILAGLAGSLCYGPTTFALGVASVGAPSAYEAADRSAAQCMAIKETIVSAFLNSLSEEVADFSNQTSYTMPADQLTKINSAWTNSLSDQSGACLSGAACYVRLPATAPTATSGTLVGCAAGDVLLECSTGASACNPFSLNGMKMVLCAKARTDEPKEGPNEIGFHVQYGAVNDQTQIVTILKDKCAQGDIVGIEGFAHNAAS